MPEEMRKSSIDKAKLLEQGKDRCGGASGRGIQRTLAAAA